MVGQSKERWPEQATCIGTAYVEAVPIVQTLILDSRVVDLSMVYIEIILCPSP